MTEAVLFEVSTWTPLNWIGVSLVLFIMAALLYEFIAWPHDDSAEDEKEAD